MESFYGGKQGISFNIVARFDYIDIEGKEQYGGDYYAVDSKGNFIKDKNNKPIVRTTENQFNGFTWNYRLHDGSDGFPKVELKGMKQCFLQGGKTNSEVGYGEYVIIDTISNRHNSSDKDNGKIFRRGMNYQGENGGAEYIGQVIGTKGEITELSIDTLENIKSENHPDSNFYGLYTVTNGDLIEGKKGEDSAIEYAWANIVDETGDVIGAKIGFKFPYLKPVFKAKQVHPYWNTKNAAPSGGEKSDGNFIVEKVKEPFYKEWELRIPQGVHGTDISNLHIDKTDVNNQVFAYEETDYSEPTAKTIKIGLGPYKVISNINLANNGILTVHYTHGASEIFNNEGQIIKWIKNIEFLDNGIINVNYNTGEKTDNSRNRIKWVNNIVLDEDGTLKVQYNTDRPDVFTTIGTISSIKSVTLDTGENEGEGTQRIKAEYNTGEIKFISNPINYIIESAVTTPEDAATYNVKPYHFLVYYAAPSKRGTVKYKGKTGWVDLGYIRGEIGGLRLIGDVDSVNNLKKTNGTWKTPEEVLGSNWSDDYIGWGITVGASELYIYDYVKKIWYSIGEALAKPNNIIAISNSTPEEKLLEGGIWFVKESINVV